MVIQIIFILIAGATLGAALMVVTSPNLIHSAMWLAGAFFGVAVIFALLNAGFLAVVQVVIYVGAIAILIIFTIMLTRRIGKDAGLRFNANWLWAAILAVVMFAGISWILFNWPGLHQPAAALNPASDPLRELGMALIAPSGYVLPFEVASVLLLAALVGAIIIAWERK